MKRYPAHEIEAKWQQRWRESGAHSPDMERSENKLYSLTMFSYPSGDKLHIGHWYNYAPADTWTRFKRMQGYHVFHPQGFDAFGMPAENYAIRHGIHPAKSTAANIGTMRQQLDRIGAMYDWSNYVDTSDPAYYRWTQWLFLKLYKMGLAYQGEAAVNWCPSDQTVLANEQVKEGLCDRCGTAVEQRILKQWFFRITRYADELLDGLDDLDWPAKTKLMQRNWIGRSYGANIHFKTQGHDEEIVVFTTRPDTVYGATYMVLAPEHPLVPKITIQAQREAVSAYQEQTGRQTELDRISQGREKTGVFTGACAINPFTGREIPIWIADYVLATYGTGAIMAVPGSDERDFEFARQFGLEIVEVVSPDGQEHGIDACFAGVGYAVNSGSYTGQATQAVFDGVCSELETMQQGGRTTQYRLRDWGISRQRYWGAPIPVIHCEECGAVPVPETDLPVLLPTDIDLAGVQGQDISPLASVASYVQVACPKCGRDAHRDTDTMDTFVDSSWYFLRYVDAVYADGPFNPERVRKWLPVDTYIGGAEHATMHLLYARFFIKALRDGGLLDFDEPFTRLIHQGVITADGTKMSKSRGNVVSPDIFVDNFGADVFRAYLMFMGPYDEGGDWNDSGINGLARFQERIWSILRLPGEAVAKPDAKMLRALHMVIRDVSRDLERLHFNTAISHLMEWSHLYSGAEAIAESVREPVIQLIAPFMPHLAEELWELADKTAGSVFASSWPDFDPDLCVADEVTIGITVNGKRRGEVTIAADAGIQEMIAAARDVAGVARHLEGKEIVKTIPIPGKLVNFVVRG